MLLLDHFKNTAILDNAGNLTTINDILTNNFAPYPYTLLYNTFGIDVIGKDRAIEFKKLLNSSRGTEEIEEFQNSYIAIMEEVVTKLIDSNIEVIPILNGILINENQMSIENFNPEPEDNEYLKWKYSNYEEYINGKYDDDEVKTVLEFSEEYFDCMI